MALTFTIETGTGSQAVYNLRWESTLGYLSQSNVHVYYGEQYDEQTIPFTWVNANQIQLSATAGVEFTVRRIAPRSAAINDYVDGAILRDKNLDDSFAQTLMIVEEIADGFISVDTQFQIGTDIDLTGHRLYNLADNPQTGNDATNRNYVNAGDNAVRQEFTAEDSAIRAEVAEVDSRAVQRTGDTMAGQLQGQNSTTPASFMPQLQVVQTIDNALQAYSNILPHPTDPEDWGFIYQPVDDTADYGGL